MPAKPKLYYIPKKIVEFDSEDNALIQHRARKENVEGFGFVPVFTSLEDLQKILPDEEFWTVQPDEEWEKTHRKLRIV